MAHSLILADFIDKYAQQNITLDPFQIDAGAALESGSDVLVCAPTGSGKTVVAHYAVTLAFAESKRCVYTAPIKALSNQKYAELVRIHGEASIGLLTGDEAINRDAPILVVTTEVLRNMLFQGAPEIADVGYVVLDEVHYLADPERGPVWEEVILSLPDHIRLISLSATVSNSQELNGWMQSVRGTTKLITSDVRPVPLEQHVAVGRKIFPLYNDDAEPASALVASLRALQYAEDSPRRFGDRDRRNLIRLLDERNMLPVIEFIFSRKGCDRAVESLVKANVWLTSSEERAQIADEIARVRERLAPQDRAAVGFDKHADALLRGAGVHHAGILPILKTLTELLMEKGLLRIVYATATLALGIDMPVRSVVIEDLRRFNGQGFVDLSATEYTQLIGRAGRRGKDSVGHAIVVGNQNLDPWALCDLGSGRVEPLISVFSPSYNTVINLLADHELSVARDLMGRSFAQYQRNADIGQIEARAGRIRRKIASEEKRLTCENGDILEYVRLRSNVARAAKSERKAAKREYRELIEHTFSDAQTGGLYACAIAGELTYVGVLSQGKNKLRIIDWDGQMGWLRLPDLTSELRQVGVLPLLHGKSLKDPETRYEIGEAIIESVDERSELGIDRDLIGSWDRFAIPSDSRVVNHPCHQCPEIKKHIRDADSLLSLDARLAELRDIAAGFHDSVGREFDRTVAVLGELGLVQHNDDGVYLGAGAQMLRELHVDSDLLLYESLSALPKDALDVPMMAGWASMFLEDERLGHAWPKNAQLRALASQCERQASYLLELENRYDIERTGMPTTGCMDVFADWVAGASLDVCLTASKLPVGDFISAGKRIVDLLGQISQAGQGLWFGEVAAKARSGMRRGDLL